MWHHRLLLVLHWLLLHHGDEWHRHGWLLLHVRLLLLHVRLLLLHVRLLLLLHERLLLLHERLLIEWEHLKRVCSRMMNVGEKMNDK